MQQAHHAREALVLAVFVVLPLCVIPACVYGESGGNHVVTAVVLGLIVLGYGWLRLFPVEKPTPPSPPEAFGSVPSHPGGKTTRSSTIEDDDDSLLLAAGAMAMMDVLSDDSDDEDGDDDSDDFGDDD